MKNLANCTPTEFLVQTNKIRKAAAGWLTLTGVMEIRKTRPVLTEDMTKEEKRAAVNAQMKANVTKMLDAILDAHPVETVQMLGLLCFVEPEEVDDHPVKEYLACLTELLDCPEVLSFFTSLASLVPSGTSTSAAPSA